MHISGSLANQSPLTKSTVLQSELEAIVESVRPKFQALKGCGDVFTRLKRADLGKDYIEVEVEYSWWELEDVQRLITAFQKHK